MTTTVEQFSKSPFSSDHVTISKSEVPPGYTQIIPGAYLNHSDDEEIGNVTIQNVNNLCTRVTRGEHVIFLSNQNQFDIIWVKSPMPKGTVGFKITNSIPYFDIEASC